MKANPKTLLAGAAALFLTQGIVQQAAIMPLWNKNYRVKASTTSAADGLSGDQLLATLAGFREITAGILWVRADEFFDQGNYDAILPIIRLVTWLDPHQIDVYATGIWHIGYNFTDEDSRSDRRYLPSALQLGKEGAKNNDATYELFFETGWVWYHKIDDDYHQAVKYWEEAQKRKDIIPARRNILASAYLRSGQLDKAEAKYQELLDEAEKTFAEDQSVFQNRQNRDTIESNLDNLLVRMAQRGIFAQRGGYYDQGEYDTKPPYDVKFTAQVSVIEPRVLKIEGTWAVLPVGNRIRLVVRDESFPTAGAARFDWDAGTTVDFEPLKAYTYLQDQLFVKNQQFSKRIDMGRDPTIYPLTTDKYLVEFYYNPRSAAAHMQDKFGYNGEGITDANYLSTDARPGQRVIYAKLELTKDQLERRGQWQNEVPVVQTKGFQAQGVVKADDVIVVPNFRSGATAPAPTPAPAPAQQRGSVPPGAMRSQPMQAVPQAAAPQNKPVEPGHEGHNH